MAALPDWTPLRRDYDAERSARRVGAVSVETHPLLPPAPARMRRKQRTPRGGGRQDEEKGGAAGGATTTVAVTAGGEPAWDPLSQMLAGGGGGGGAGAGGIEGGDPLLGGGGASGKDGDGAGEHKSGEEDGSGKDGTGDGKGLEDDDGGMDGSLGSWEVKKQSILREFTVQGNITLGMDLSDPGAGPSLVEGDVPSTKRVDRYAARLRHLEGSDGTGGAGGGAGRATGTFQISQSEYMAHITRTKENLQKAWARDERVSSLMLAIQCAKMLGETHMPQFYPSIFVLSTDVLDLFGDMVFRRLKEKAEMEKGEGTGRRVRLRPDFTAADILVEAKETCRNWFFKIACIRELLPRIFVEIALLPCYRFLSEGEYPQILGRISSLIRGIGDPLVAVYARCYLVRVGQSVAPDTRTYATNMLLDYLLSFPELSAQRTITRLERQGLTVSEMLRLHSPAVEWILHAVGKDATRDTFKQVLQHYRDRCNNSMVLRYIVSSFDASLFANNSTAMAALVRLAGPSHISPVEIYRVLGLKFASVPPPEDQRIALLNEVWRSVAKTTDITPYVACANAWLEVVLRHYSDREVNIMLRDVTAHLEQAANGAAAAAGSGGGSGNAEQGDLDDTAVRHLEQLVHSLISHSKELGSGILTSDHLLTILDVFKGSRRVEICKDILASFGKTAEKTSDAILIHTLFDLARLLHDSIDSLSPDGEKRHISAIITGFISKIDFGRDLEQQLSTYVECRAAFSNLDAVKDYLILRVADLAMRAHRFVRGKHTRKTAAFVKACLAYCHITIPSIERVFRRLHLLLFLAQVALVNQCLPQTDTFLKACISLIPEVPTVEDAEGQSRRMHTEERLVALLRNLIATLVVTPGHPEHGPFYIIHGLLNAMPQYEWQPNTGARPRVYIELLVLLATLSQRKFPYRVDRVESNDQLYGSTNEYMAELLQLLNTVMQDVLGQLTALGESGSKTAQVRLILDLSNRVVEHMELNESTVAFVIKLLELAKKNGTSLGHADNLFMRNTLAFIRTRAAEDPTSAPLAMKARELQQG